MDLALNNLQRLICHKTHQTIKPTIDWELTPPHTLKRGDLNRILKCVWWWRSGEFGVPLLGHYSQVHSDLELLLLVINVSCLISLLVLLLGLRIYWPCREVRSPTCTKLGVLSMILNCIKWWGSNPRDPMSVEYCFIVITPNSTLTQDPIYGSKRYV